MLVKIFAFILIAAALGISIFISQENTPTTADTKSQPAAINTSTNLQEVPSTEIQLSPFEQEYFIKILKKTTELASTNKIKVAAQIEVLSYVPDIDPMKLQIYLAQKLQKTSEDQTKLQIEIFSIQEEKQMETYLQYNTYKESNKVDEYSEKL